jgi:hypothetical protein
MGQPLTLHNLYSTVEQAEDSPLLRLVVDRLDPQIDARRSTALYLKKELCARVHNSNYYYHHITRVLAYAVYMNEKLSFIHNNL